MNHFELSDEDFELLTFAIQTAATTVLQQQGDRPMFGRLTTLANTVNRDNPNWTPYRFAEAAWDAATGRAGDEWISPKKQKP